MIIFNSYGYNHIANLGSKNFLGGENMKLTLESAKAIRLGDVLRFDCNGNIETGIVYENRSCSGINFHHENSNCFDFGPAMLNSGCINFELFKDSATQEFNGGIEYDYVSKI